MVQQLDSNNYNMLFAFCQFCVLALVMGTWRLAIPISGVWKVSIYQRRCLKARGLKYYRASWLILFSNKFSNLCVPYGSSMQSANNVKFIITPKDFHSNPIIIPITLCPCASHMSDLHIMDLLKMKTQARKTGKSSLPPAKNSPKYVVDQKVQRYRAPAS